MPKVSMLRKRLAFTRRLFVLCLIGSIGFSSIARAQSDNNRNNQRLPNTQWYSGIGNQSGDRTTFRDASGRTQGSATQSGSRTTFRDGQTTFDSLYCKADSTNALTVFFHRGDSPGEGGSDVFWLNTVSGDGEKCVLLEKVLQLWSLQVSSLPMVQMPYSVFRVLR